MDSLPLFGETCAHPKLVGIARIAAEADSLREGHNVEYFTLGARSLLSRVVQRTQSSVHVAINPIGGCEFACKYCYARYTTSSWNCGTAWISNERFSLSSKRRGSCDPS